MSVTTLWTEIKDKLDASLSTDVNATYQENLSSKKSQVVLMPIEENTDTVTGFSGSFESRNTYNVIIDAYGETTLAIDELEENIKSALKDDDLSGGYSLLDVTTVDNSQVVNDNTYYNKSLTFTYIE